MLLILVPLSISCVYAFSIDHAGAEKMINDDKEYAREIEEMKSRISLLKSEIETRQNKQNTKLINNYSHNPPKIYTVQTGSFLHLARAEKEFNFLMKVLNKKYHSFLRVEKVGKHYTVRIGIFESYNSVTNVIKPIATVVPKSLILKTVLMNERLRRCICY
jgi:hypothetical protein